VSAATDDRFALVSGVVHHVAGSCSFLQSTPEAASNSGLVVGDDALLVVDTRLTPELGRNLRDYVRGEYGQRVGRLLVVNTHFHGDHWFGNQAFQDATIFSSTWTRQKLASEWAAQVDLFASIRPHQAAEFGAVQPALPNIGVRGEVEIELGGAMAKLVPMGPAHTPGDVVVLAEQDTVAYCGDIVFNSHWPVLWDADVAGWRAALQELLGRDLRVVIPGHGPAGGPELLEQMLRCLDFLEVLAEADESTWESAIVASEFRGWLHRRRVAPSVATVRAQQGVAATSSSREPSDDGEEC
jgi:cyclase